MDKISDKQKLEWLATTDAPVPRAMINTTDWKARPLETHGELPSEPMCTPHLGVMQLLHQVDQPSFGNFDIFPPELMCMVLGHLTCEDLKALSCCSIGSRIAILAFNPYRRLLEHVPAILSILKETGLARSFTITKIYKTFASTLCTTCGQFGGYVFLPSFTRCCRHCAETEPKFLPISREGAKKEYGVKGKRILDRLPQLSTIQGFYSSFHGEIKYHTKKLILLSRELIEKRRDTDHPVPFARQSRRLIGDDKVQAHQRYMALAPLPCYIPQSDSMEKGVYCAGCALRAKEHLPCLGSGIIYSSETIEKTLEGPITEGPNFCCFPGEYRKPCLLRTARDTLHDSRQIIRHLEGCVAAQALLRSKWARVQRNIFGDDT